jgi:hypothetical protein
VKERKAIAALVGSFMIAMAVSSAMADGLAPCDKFADAFVGEVEEHVGDSPVGDTVVSFVALPSFAAEWALQIIRNRDGFMLRSVQFKRSVWYGAYREVSPGHFARDPDAVQPDPIVHTVSLSPYLARAVRDLMVAEIAHADPANARLGFDGEGFYFYANGQCGSTWSPVPATRPERLVDILENLKIQAYLPTRLLQLFWEKRVFVKLSHYTGSQTMPVSQYLVVIALGFGIIAFGALPLLIASMVMLVPKRLPKKRRFVMVSGVLSYGFTCFVALVLLPFFLIGSQVSAQLAVDGHSTGASTLDLIVKYSLTVLFAAWVVFSVAVPIYLRRIFWLNWIASIESASSSRATALG